MAVGLDSWLVGRPRGRNAAQAIFYNASAFNQPLESWDVGQVTSIWVRWHPLCRRRGRGLASGFVVAGQRWPCVTARMCGFQGT